METKLKLKNIGMALAAVAASAFVASHLTGCATDMAAQNSTAATTQLQHSCKGMDCRGMAEEGGYRHHHHKHHRHMHPMHKHHKAMHRHSDTHKMDQATEAGNTAQKAASHKSKRSKPIGVAGQ